ncbi:hypothetical protein HDU97_005931 [Phlyctochytrium planicorne]|nr:hypothetical protein HDU97_005931 [Phlyctochytrium planicorne]
MEDDGQQGNEDDLDMIEPASPIMELDETIDYSLVYALHTFVANLEGQVCVLKGDSLELLDDSNSYWWLVKCIKTDESTVLKVMLSQIGYIPAENVETPFERLARLNKIRNVQLASINAQDAEEGDKIPPPNRRGITFSDNHEIFEDYDGMGAEEDEEGEYEEGEEVEETVTSPTETQGTSAGRSREKTQSLSLGQNFLKKLLGRNSLSRKDKGPKADNRQSIKSPTTAERQNSFPQAVEVAAPEEPAQATPTKEPINVLRIFAGNVDLKATSKAVAVSKEMNFGELLEAALRKFRVPGAVANEYYLSVLHLDSQERRLKEADNVFQMLDALRHKQLPGVSARAANGSRSVSPSVHMNDDNIIKVIINKKLNLFEKNYHLIRIYMQDDTDASGRIRTYKTIGINSTAKIADIVEIAIKKFKLSPDPNFSYTLCSIFRSVETARSPTESILDILRMAENSPEDIDFILRKDWLGEGSMPRVLSEAPEATSGSQITKPSFLEDLPMSPSQGSFASGGVMDVNGQQTFGKPTPPGVTSPLSKEIRINDSPTTLPNVIESRAEGSPGGVNNANSWMGGVLNSIEFNSTDNGLLSNTSFQTNGTGSASTSSNAISLPNGSSSMIAARGGSNSSWSPPSPPEESDVEKMRKQAAAEAKDDAQKSQEAQVVPPPRVSSVDGASNSFWAGPPGVVPPRKGSLTDASVPRRLLAEYANSNPEITEADETGKPLPPPGDSNDSSPQNASPTLAPSTTTQSTTTTTTTTAAIKANFEYMEEYLEEIMKDNINPTKLEALETALRKNSTDGAPKRADTVGQPYTDSGLSQILRSQRSQPELRRPSDPGLSSLSFGSTSPPSQRNRSNSTNPIAVTRLKDMYSDIEKDLDKSIGNTGSVGNFALPTPPSSSPKPNASRLSKSDSNITSLSRGPAVPSIVTDANGRRVESDPSMVTPLSARIDPNDPMSAIERFREAELMLNAMQRDLDSLLASAVNAFQVTETIYARS